MPQTTGPTFPHNPSLTNLPSRYSSTVQYPNMRASGGIPQRYAQGPQQPNTMMPGMAQPVRSLLLCFFFFFRNSYENGRIACTGLDSKWV